MMFYPETSYGTYIVPCIQNYILCNISNVTFYNFAVTGKQSSVMLSGSRASHFCKTLFASARSSSSSLAVTFIFDLAKSLMGRP